MEKTYSSWMLERISIGEVLRLRLGVTSIVSKEYKFLGRLSTSIIRILDSNYVSRNHAEIVISADDTSITIRDLNSINGVYVNETLFKNNVAELHAGDRIGIGVTIDNEVNLEHPIYLLRHVPIHRPTRPLPAVVATVKAPLAAPHAVHPPQAAAEQKPFTNNSNEASISVISYIKKEPLPKNSTPNKTISTVITPIAFITLSDDEEEEEVDKKPLTCIKTEAMQNVPFTNNTINTCEGLPKISAVVGNAVSVNISSESNPQLISEKPVQQTKDHEIHVPIISSVKQEQVRSVSDNIMSIFGETDDVILDKIKDINPYVYNNLNGNPMQMSTTNSGKPPLVNGDSISLCSDEEDDEIIQNRCEIMGQLFPTDKLEEDVRTKSSKCNEQSAKSPNIFDSSLNSSKDKSEDVQQQQQINPANSKGENTTEKQVKEPKDTVTILKNVVITSSFECMRQQSALTTVAPTTSATDDAEDYNCYEPRSDDEDVEELMFSQVIINDMKAEMANDTNQEDDEDDNGIDLIAPYIKIEPNSEPKAWSEKTTAKEPALDTSYWIISDDEVDEELDNKVSDWTNKLFSQSFSCGNMSQVFDNTVGDENDDDNCKTDEDTDADNDFYNRELDDADKIIDDMFASLQKRFGSGFDNDINKIKDEDDGVVGQLNKASETEDDLEDNSNDNSPVIKRRSFIRNRVSSNSDDEHEKEEVTTTVTLKELNSCESPLIKRRNRTTKRVLSMSDEDEQKEEENIETRAKLRDQRNKSASGKHQIKGNLRKDQSKSYTSTYKRVLSMSDVDEEQEEEVVKSSSRDKIIDQIKKSIPSKNKTKENKHKDRSESSTLSKPLNHINERRRSERPEKVADVNLQERRKSYESVKRTSIDTEILTPTSKKTPASSAVSGIAITPKRSLPQVIDAPQLPRHKGKLRGVSAVSVPLTSRFIPAASRAKPNDGGARALSSDLEKKAAALRESMRHDEINHDLKRKWTEKPSVARKRKSEENKVMAEERRKRLQELAGKQQESKKEPIKRKLSTDDEHKTKKPKVKVTMANRGAFLTEDISDSTKAFKIPKIKSNKEASGTAKPTNAASASSASANSVLDGPSTSTAAAAADAISRAIATNEASAGSSKTMQRQTSTEKRLETFSEQLCKADELLVKRKHSDNVSSPSTTPVCRTEATAARAHRTTNKITFASMQKNFVESHQNQKKLDLLISTTRSCLTNTNRLETGVAATATTRPKKTVRFNDSPVVHYIECVKGAHKKVDQKDSMPRSSYNDRRHLVRRTYPLVDRTENIISLILRWSNEWLMKRNAEADAAVDQIYPMPTQFSSFDHYKSVIFPLMKLEFLSSLEREYNAHKNLKPFKVVLQYSTDNKDRLMLITKFNYQNRSQSDSSKFDLVILEFGNKRTNTFAYLSANRKGVGSSNTIVFEIIAKNFSKEFFNPFVDKEINVRPIQDNVRVEFGAFNSVYQLAETPLFQKILNPLELLHGRRSPTKKKNTCTYKYKGFDTLNVIQKEVLFNTYSKAIEETTPNITLIHGPPGTGKSCVITNLALQLLYGEEVRNLDKKILICAQSNGAVDVIAEKLYRIRSHITLPEARFRLVRYGMFEKINHNVQPISLQKLVEREQLLKLKERNQNIQIENKENMRNQMLELEAQIAEMKSRNIKGTVQEDELIEKQRQLQLMRDITTHSLRPEDERSLHTWFLSNANIVCATLSSCVKLSQFVNYFDICIIDEATQCTEPYTLLPLKFGINQLVLVGDTQQLPATVLSKKALDYGMGTSLFTRIQRCLDAARSNGGTKTTSSTSLISHALKTQYRMHPEICKWPNAYFYKNELLNAETTLKLKTDLAPFSILNLAYSQNVHCSQGKITNDLEAEFVAKLLKALDGYIPTKYNTYGVITPYAHQRNTLVNFLRSSGLTNIMVNTIDSYQGLEKDVIVISNARTNGIGFLANYQRLNVALTRPKKCLILCGNFKNLESVPVWRSLLNNARERNLFHEISADCVQDIQKNVIDKIKVKKR